jgi:hypothetical protein
VLPMANQTGCYWDNMSVEWGAEWKQKFERIRG